MKPPQRILIKAVNWLGDLVMTTPAMRAVRRAYPAAHLAILVRKELAGFFAGADWVDEVIGYGVARGLAGVRDRQQVVREIRARRFDTAIVLPRSFESAFWAALARVPERVGFSADARGLLLTRKTRRPAALLRHHQVNDCLYLLRETLGIEGDPADFALRADDELCDRMEAWLLARRRRRSAPLIGLAVAAAYGPAKEWPVERYAALIDALADRHGAECVLVGAPRERPACERVSAASRAGALIAAGDTGVGEAVALLSLCAGFAGNDSGSMHVAGALGIPTVGIFGSTNPQRTAPLGPRTRVLYHRIECSPCLERTCRFGHYDCLKRIEVAEVLAGLEELDTFGSAGV